MKYRILLFDADNTLLDFDANEKESFYCMMRDVGEVCTEEIYRYYHELNSDWWRKIERKEASLEYWLGNRFTVFMRHYGKEVDGQLWEKIFRGYLNHGTQQIPYAHEVLRRLQAEYDLYVITNGVEETQLYRMRESGLAMYFRDIFISKRIGDSKPSKRFFEYVKNHIPDFEVERTLVIGDSLTSDIKGGYDAGIDTCWFSRDLEAKPEGIQPTYIIHALPELFDVLV